VILNLIAERQDNPAIGDFGYDPLITEDFSTTLLGQVVTHVHSDQGWLRIRSVSRAWIAQHIADFAPLKEG
jgi:hypothetical protein